MQFCPHTEDARCTCRKPAPRLLLRLMDLWRVEPSETLFVGDLDTDRQAAENAGCRFAWAHEFFRWERPEP